MKPFRTTANYDYDHLWPEETCPVCGKRFLRRCRRSEWGYWYNASPSQLQSALTLLCSSACSRKYAEMRFLDSCREALASRSGQACRLIDLEGLTPTEAAKRAGLKTPGAIYSFQFDRWKELEWLKAHKWEVPA